MAGDDDVTAPARESSSVPSVPGPSSASAQREQSAVAAAPSPALSSTSSQTRYQPQFSASTQMILQKIRGETSNYNKAISSASASGAFQQAAYEDTKRRLAQSMNMSSSLTMPLPPPIASGSGSSRAPVRFMGDSLNTKLSGTSETPKTAPLRGTAKVAAKRGGRAAKGTKRRKTGDDEAVSAGGSDASEDEGDGLSQEAVHTMTKSGRQVSKPTQFNPAAVSSASKRKHYGKRTPEQALCKVCTRGLSPPKNQIVFCDGCNFCWHQLCHDPFIDDEFVSDEARSWFCRACTAKREKHLAKKKSVSDFKGASWANKTVEQRRAYLASQPQGNLVNLIMYSLELHPDLPLFPVPESAAAAKRAAQNAGASSARGGSQRAEPSAAGPINYTAPSTVANPPKSHGKNGTPPKEDEIEGLSDSVPPAWPKPGQGVLANLVLNEDDFQDNNDFEAFSVATYDAKGKKVVENGMAVSAR